MAEKGRGFAAMDQQKQREIASRGGRAAHKRGTAHQFTAEEAAAAGRKGGQSVSRNREHMAQIGRKGGLATHHRQAEFTNEKTADRPEAVEAARPPMETPPVPDVPVHHQPDPVEARDEADWDSEEMLDEGRIGNENATEEHNITPANDARFEEQGEGERQGGHGYGSFETEGSPQQTRR